jgi:hypothetical protein
LPTLAFELDQLRAADRHLAEAERRVAALAAQIKEQRRLGRDVSLSEDVLDALLQGLEVFQVHRDLIVRMVDDLRSGRLRGH